MTESPKKSRRVPLPVLVIGVVFLSGFLILVGSTRKNIKAGLNTPIRYDDFVFQVESVKVSDSNRKKMLTYEVSLRVDNMAKRVGFNFDARGTAILDQAGHHYPPVAPGPISTIPAGRHDEYLLRFEVPSEVTEPRMKVLASDPVGDFLEFAIFGDKEFLLPKPSDAQHATK